MFLHEQSVQLIDTGNAGKDEPCDVLERLKLQAMWNAYAAAWTAVAIACHSVAFLFETK